MYWEWLSGIRLSAGKVQIWLDEDKHLHIKATDYLYRVTLYEVPILAIVSELRNRMLNHTINMTDVLIRLEPKIVLSNQNQMFFSEFGTRRRYSYNVQEAIVKSLKDSATYCTYTSAVFFKNLSRKQAKLFDGVRQDSGDEFKFVTSAIARYKELGIDPTTKTIIFSNALTFEKALEIREYCRGRIRCAFGIGTNLTNDTGHKPSNIVMKLTSCQMNKNQPVFNCVKLSDDLGKHTGLEQEVEHCMNELGL